MTDMEHVKAAILKSRNDRNWAQFHNPKDLAISISLEASELLELFQWSAGDCVREEKHSEQVEELADILIYCILLADTLNVSIEDAIIAKIKQNEEKYPIEKAFGASTKYTDL